jgi:hypothetical protein
MDVRYSNSAAISIEVFSFRQAKKRKVFVYRTSWYCERNFSFHSPHFLWITLNVQPVM